MTKFPIFGFFGYFLHASKCVQPLEICRSTWCDTSPALKWTAHGTSHVCLGSLINGTRCHHCMARLADAHGTFASRLLPCVNSERPGAAFLGLQVSDIVTPLVSQIFFEKDVLCSQAEQKPKANFLPTSPGSHAATAL